ncbi:uncharacterized protein LOC123681048 [Harmonia axyridis]|uniref:uncharacterized protein LOC123681048 n=1 Tax=Harmonia axyridis TaxID=115357 RepID=UPI001E277558|nr:uncharacterized protein LOC123681048 [Harmonia axyridis]
MDQPKRKSLAGPMLLAAAQPTHEVAAGLSPSKKADQETGEGIKGPAETGGFKKTKGPKDTTTIEGRAIITGSAECTADQLCCQYNEDFTMYAGGGVDGNLKIFESDSNELLMTLADNEVQGRTASVTCVKHRPVTKNYPINNCYTCTYVNGLVKCWNYNFKQCIYTIRENRQTYGLAYHPRLPKFITYGDNMKIYLYDEETKVQERVLQASDRKESHDGPISRVFAGRFNPRSNYEFLTGGWDDLVHLWDLRAPHAVKHISGVHLCGEGLDINKRGTEILTCSWRKEEQLQLWDYSSFKIISTFYPDVHACKLYCGRFMNSDFLCCCGGDPALLRVVDLQTSYSAVIIHSLPSAVYHLNVGPQKGSKANKPQVEEEVRQKADISRVPKLCYTCGRKLIQLDFV